MKRWAYIIGLFILYAVGCLIAGYIGATYGASWL